MLGRSDDFMGNNTGLDPGGLPQARKRHEKKGRAGE
jgi:hypothetical protein